MPIQFQFDPAHNWSNRVQPRPIQFNRVRPLQANSVRTNPIQLSLIMSNLIQFGSIRVQRIECSGVKLNRSQHDVFSYAVCMSPSPLISQPLQIKSSGRCGLRSFLSADSSADFRHDDCKALHRRLGQPLDGERRLSFWRNLHSSSQVNLM